MSVRGTHVGSRVDKTEQPLVTTRLSTLTTIDVGIYLELGCKEQVGTVNDGFVHLTRTNFISARSMSSYDILTPCTAAASEHIITR